MDYIGRPELPGRSTKALEILAVLPRMHFESRLQLLSSRSEVQMSLCNIALFFLLIGCSVADAQDNDLPDAQDLADSAAKRFPQPVRAGDLLNRDVLEPDESRPILGRVRAVVRQADGTIDVIIDYGGLLGFFTRPIAVPVNAMALLGKDMEVIDYEPEQLRKFPTFNPAGTKSLPPDTVLGVGLAKPAH